jgi:putative membrane protein
MRRIAAFASVLTALPLAAALAQPAAGSSAPMSKTDSMFIKKAAIGGMTEVQEGQAAVSSASSPDIKSFAQKMVDAHTANNQELATLVQSKGGSVPSDLDSMHQKQLDALTKKTGTAFDKTYVTDQIKDHQAMEKVMQNEIDHGKDPDLKAFAQKTLPVVQDHLSMAKALQPGT